MCGCEDEGEVLGVRVRVRLGLGLGLRRRRRERVRARVRLRAHLVRLRASTWIGLEHMHASATWLGSSFGLEVSLGFW